MAVEMVRLRHVSTGVVVQVREGKRMGPEWAPVDEKSTKPARRRSTKPDDE